MKKILVIGFAAASVLVSCNKDKVVNVAESGTAIGFSSFIDKSTKVTEDVTLANLKTFYLYGWRKDDMIFNAQEVTNENGTCTYSPLQYWEAGYTYNFEAIAPAHDGTKVNFVANKDGGTVTFTNDGTTDLIYAKADSRLTDETITADPGAVSLTFSHLLSRVKFTFLNGFPSNAAAKLTVNKVTISDTYSSATITPAEGDWSDHGTADYAIIFPSEGVVDVAPQTGKETEHMYLIPGASKVYNISFEVVFSQGTVASTYSHTATVEMAIEKGKSYNLTATLDATNINPETQLYPIEFTADETPWADFNGSNEPIPVTID